MIFLIEDSLVDAEAIERAFVKNGMDEEIRHFETGDLALEHLNNCFNNDKDVLPRLPRIIILDLNLPGLDGREVLRRLKNSDRLKAIPVLVLSSTTSSIDITKVYADGANVFLRKPISFETLTEMMQYTRQYWFDVAVMPKQIG